MGAVNRVMKQMAPAILGVSVAQISLVINTIFASYLQSGSVSWMYYADRLMELPSGVLGAALGTILLPTLSKTCSQSEYRADFPDCSTGVAPVYAADLPAAVGLAVLSFPLVATLFMYRNLLFDAQMTQHALIAYSFGLIIQSMIKVLAPGFYARQNIKTPVKIAIFTLVCTQLMNFAFVGPSETCRAFACHRFGRVYQCGIVVLPFIVNTVFTNPVKGGGVSFVKCRCRLS